MVGRHNEHRTSKRLSTLTYNTVATCRISRDGFYGRHLVANRDIKLGEVILQESPLVTGPPPRCQHRCCVTCYNPISEKEHVVCPRGCGWPFCSEECAGANAHVPECHVTRLIRGDKVEIESWDSPSQLFDSLIVLRCLYFRESNPSVWDKLCSLEPHTEKRIASGKYERDSVEVAQFLITTFKLEAYSEEEILKICGVIQINGYGIRLTSPPFVAVYDTLSFIEHHCISNCSKSWSLSADLTVMAAAPVSKEGHLSICYTNPLWGTVARRRHLSQELLLCRCDRCADATESGTYYSGVRCTDNSCEGYLLPEDPLLDEPDEDTSYAGGSAWLCNKCQVRVRPQKVSDILYQVKNKMDTLDKSNVDSLKLFLESGSLVLHSNHYYLTEIKMTLVTLMGSDERGVIGLSDTDLRLKIVLCREVMALAKLLFQGVPRVTGVMRFELQRCILEDVRRISKHGEADDAAVANQTAEAYDLLKEAVHILRYEPPTLPEGQVALLATKQLEEKDYISLCH